MELTGQLYEQIGRYVNAEMNEREKLRFEAAISNNEELSAEVRLYKEIQAAFESASEKLKENSFLDSSEKKKNEEEILAMITRARKEWERANEVENKVKNENEDEDEVSAVTEMHSIKHQPAKIPERSKTINMQGWPLLAAAVVFGIICFGVWWFVQNKQTTSNIAVNENETNSKTVIPKKEASLNEIVPVNSDTSSIKNQLPSTENPKAQKLNTKELFLAHFKPDAAPTEKEPTLEEPFSFYVAKNYNDAIETFEMAKATLNTRGEEKKAGNTPFDIHYYLALSYMAANKNVNNAIAELKTAIKITSEPYLKSKANWYLGLAYLNKENIKQAKNYLAQIVDNNQSGEYESKARNLLKALDRNDSSM